MIEKNFGYLLSSLVALIEHVEEHDRLFLLHGMDRETLDEMLLGEPLGCVIWLRLLELLVLVEWKLFSKVSVAVDIIEIIIILMIKILLFALI